MALTVRHAWQGEMVTTPMVNCIVAACSQIGDMSRAFETFETYGSFGLKPDTGSYNAVLQGCVAHNFLESVPKVRITVPCSPVPTLHKARPAWDRSAAGLTCAPSPSMTTGTHSLQDAHAPGTRAVSTAVQVLEEMREVGVPYHTLTHTAIVDSMIVKRDAKGAIAYVLQLKADGTK